MKPKRKMTCSENRRKTKARTIDPAVRVPPCLYPCLARLLLGNTCAVVISYIEAEMVTNSPYTLKFIPFLVDTVSLATSLPSLDVIAACTKLNEIGMLDIINDPSVWHEPCIYRCTPSVMLYTTSCDNAPLVSTAGELERWIRENNNIKYI